MNPQYHTTSKNVSWCRHCGKQDRSSSKDYIRPSCLTCIYLLGFSPQDSKSTCYKDTYQHFLQHYSQELSTELNWVSTNKRLDKENVINTHTHNGLFKEQCYTVFKNVTITSVALIKLSQTQKSKHCLAPSLDSYIKPRGKTA